MSKVAEEKSAKRKESFKSIKIRRDSEKSPERVDVNSLNYTGEENSPYPGSIEGSIMSKYYKTLKLNKSDVSR